LSTAPLITWEGARNTKPHNANKNNSGTSGGRSSFVAFIFSPNVTDDLPPLAFGIRGCTAAEMPKGPKAWWLGPSAR